MTRNKSTFYPESSQECAKIVGGSAQVNRCVEMWVRYADLIQIIVTNGLLEFCEGEVFDSQNYTHHKKGMAYLPDFLLKCYAEREMNQKILEAKLAKEKAKPIDNPSP